VQSKLCLRYELSPMSQVGHSKAIQQRELDCLALMHHMTAFVPELGCLGVT